MRQCIGRLAMFGTVKTRTRELACLWEGSLLSTMWHIVLFVYRCWRLMLATSVTRLQQLLLLNFSTYTSTNDAHCLHFRTWTQCDRIADTDAWRAGAGVRNRVVHGLANLAVAYLWENSIRWNSTPSKWTARRLFASGVGRTSRAAQWARAIEARARSWVTSLINWIYTANIPAVTS